MELSGRVVLIIEDGDEYLENLSRFVPGPRYLQAKSGAAALARLAEASVDLVYLDMRFDRAPQAALLGDHAAVTRQQGGDPRRGWRHLAHHQGLYILAALHAAGHQPPLILSYDFSLEPHRWRRLNTRPGLAWVSDAARPEEIRALMKRLILEAS
ncbi:hypothetical protein KKF91_15705 [Myxococcota bacterium]|nr:hypothetical protein [Myxococcota bacterium]MBU1431986.1 hypothetical protein [Myxococcota bacterium]MBU1900028.1 hypothetical protein [Myxococcota bacterium]